ncbi:hypothetical protein ADK48_21125, partial [Streptomyces rimosus subsp. rimosus]
EEVFTLCADEAERTAFLGTVADLARSGDRRIRITLGIRPDFYARFFAHPGLVAVLPPAALDLALRTWLAGRSDASRALLVIDQFEEVFTLCADEAERTAFLGTVADLARSGDRRIRI